MADLSTSDDPIRIRIDLLHSTDADFWCRVLDVDLSELRRAIQHVGPQLQAVYSYLTEQRLQAH